MKVSVVGTGYVGLVTGTCFSETGLVVTCVDIDKKKINGLKNGEIPIYEPGLEPMIKKNIEKGRLFFTTNLNESLEDADAVFIAVGTPPDENGSADLKHVLEVGREIGRLIDHYLVIVTKSTVPVGTAEKVRKTVQDEIYKRGTDVEFDVASNPEFLKEGAAIQDFLRPDRIVIGTDSDRAKKTMERLYKPFLLNNHPIYFMNIPSSELTKYTANSMLATKISFMNDIANLCEILGADINMVRKGIGSDSRIGNKFIYSGVGYGGSCFPKDVQALIRTANEKNYPLRILQAVEDVNHSQKEVIFNKIMKYFNGNLKDKTIGLWGLSFKPQTNDMREAPSLVIIDKLLNEGASVKAYDPVAMNEAKRILGGKVEFVNEQYEAILDADALVLITEWPEFRMLNFKILEKSLKNKVVFDGRNIYDMEEMEEHGFDYYAIGRGK
ncbi:MAG: UDP-glucose/GDP-mannose dehydrogenase family protein [Bacteroidetes bacterium]|nr:UDP-glucose/GDP-mannose dehydrogenase family protein [Bacteroidota bacterium]